MVRPALLVVVAAALFDAQGRVLVQQRPLHKAHGGLWEFPGGKVEAGEGPIAGLVREIDEELGLALAPDSLFPIAFASDDGVPGDECARPILLALYGCRSWSGEPALRDGQQLAWFAPEALETLAMPPLDVPLAAALCSLSKGGTK